jgi:hypothetical protein
MKEVGNKNFDEDFLLNGKKGNGTELESWTTMETVGTLGRKSTTPRQRETERRQEENMEDRAEKRCAPMMGRSGAVKLIGQIVQVRGFAEGRLSDSSLQFF